MGLCPRRIRIIIKSSFMLLMIGTHIYNCYDIPLFKGLVAGLPLIRTDRAEHQGISLWAGPASMIAESSIQSILTVMFMCSAC